MVYSRCFYSVIFFFTSIACISAQADSLRVGRTVDLTEVVVHCDEAQNTPGFQYYKQSKLPTTEEILARMAGVSLIRRGDYGMEPGLRSYTGGRINTTISGMKIFGACTDKMDPVSIYIEPNNLEAIDVAQGASGSKYGSTIGGSMNMDIKEVPCTPIHSIYFTTSSSYASVNNAYNGNFSLVRTGPKVSFRIGAVYRKASDYKEGGGQTVLHSGYEKANISAALTVKLRSWDHLVFDYIGDLGSHIGFPALFMDTRTARAHIASAAYVSHPDRRVLRQVEVKAYFNHIYHLMDNSQRTDGIMQMTMPGWSTTAGTYADMKLDAPKDNHIELRADYYANYTKASMTMFPLYAPEMFMFTLPDNLRQFAGAYAADEWRITASHILRFNVRAEMTHAALLTDYGRSQWGVFTDTTSTTRFLPSGSIQYIWMAPHHFSVSLTGAYGTSAPTGGQLYGYYLFNTIDNYDYIGNPALRTEKSLQGDVTIAYHHRMLGLSLTGYYHHLYDYIIGSIMTGYLPVMQGAAGVKRYINIPGAFITGAEASLSFDLKHGFQSMNTLTYSYGSLSDGSPVPMLSPLRGISSVRYTYRGWHIQAEADWATARDRINASVGETATGAYILLNMRTGYSLMYHEHIWSLDVSAENMLDQKYRAYSDWGSILRPGRSIVVYLSYSFGKVTKR
jgi:iron complex outermembrane receptor protein